MCPVDVSLVRCSPWGGVVLVGSGVVKVLNVVFVVWGYSGVTMSDVIQKK